jgi:hypothetical protein
LDASRPSGRCIFFRRCIALKTLGLLEVGLTVADGGQCGEHPLFQLVLEVNFIDELLCRPRILLQIF